ncbi:hypothetical protein [Nodosilinea sp. E11]|uniref:hypothetical protein n=1 Tax=Nodosilinea sp. E11 TaxID=3037479 RepID=UPI0029348C84|nr:hypothetical protein [Nodosilinea sp. E11]WOD41847.1 hypothetical protein RRF56_13710 [Nodosilinea sp. E11]
MESAVLERFYGATGGGAIPVVLLTLGVQLARTELVFGRYESIGAAATHRLAQQ